MTKFVFPVEVELRNPPTTAGGMQEICASLENALFVEFEDTFKSAIVLMPVEGCHLRTVTTKGNK